MALGQRIMIIGSGGAGKSTLARRLGDVLGLPVIHLDAVHWQSGWVATPREAWVPKVEAMAEGECWIIDGNYGATIPHRLARADTVIFLDYPWWLCLWRVVQRWAVYRGQTRPDMTPGCAEQLDAEFLKWICLDFPRRSRPRLVSQLEEHRAGRQIIIHRSPGETRRWLAALEMVKGAST